METCCTRASLDCYQCYGLCHIFNTSGGAHTIEGCTFVLLCVSLSNTRAACLTPWGPLPALPLPPPRSILYWNATGVLADLYDTYAGGTAAFRATAAALRVRAAHVRTQISRELWSDAKGAFVVRARPPTQTHSDPNVGFTAVRAQTVWALGQTVCGLRGYE